MRPSAHRAPRRTATGRARSWLRAARWGALPLALAGAFVTISSVAFADAGQVSPTYQGYSAPSGGQDPYQDSNPQDIHVAGFGGQPEVDGEVVLNLDSLPLGSTIEGMTLQVTPNASTTDNVNAGGAAIEACPLDHPITSNGYQSTQPTFDCNGAHAAGEPQPDGRWFFDVTSLAQTWLKSSNTGLALVAYAPPNDTGQAVSPSAWSVGFDHTKTVASVDYTPGATFSVSVPAASGGGATTTVYPAAPVHAVPPVTAPSSAATPAATPGASPSRAPSVTSPGVGTLSPPATAHNQWLWFGIGLFAAAALLVIVGAGQQVLRGAPAGAASRMVAALQSSRSQFATPLAVLTLAGVCALGFTGQTLGASTAAGAGGGVAANSSAGGGGSAAGGGVAGSAGPGASAQAGTGGGATGPGGVAGGGGGGGGAATGNDNGQDGPGVTHTTVRIGFIYTTNQNAANSAFGANVAPIGNTQSEEQALVAYVNSHGGIAGRQIQPVYVAFDNAQAESDPTINEEICKELTEDYHVWAVVGGAGPPDDQQANQCYAAHGTINFDGEASEFGSSWLRSAAPYVWYVNASALDRTMRWEVSGLGSRGFFSGSPELGVVVADDSTNRSIFSSVTMPALQGAGESSAKVDPYYVQYASLDQAANQMKQAVISFQANQVTNVMFQGGGADGIGSFALLFMLSAQSQSYFPRYGLSSDDGPSALVTSIPQQQFTNALSIGIEPGVDTDDAHYHQYPYGPDQTKCNSIESAAGNPSSGQQAALAVNTFCDIMFDLQQAAQPLTGGALNAQLWADQVMKTSNLFDASLYSRTYGAGKWDGAGGYRELHAVENCETGSNGQQEACFEYDNGTLYG